VLISIEFPIDGGEMNLEFLPNKFPDDGDDDINSFVGRLHFTTGGTT